MESRRGGRETRACTCRWQRLGGRTGMPLQAPYGPSERVRRGVFMCCATPSCPACWLGRQAAVPSAPGASVAQLLTLTDPGRYSCGTLAQGCQDRTLTERGEAAARVGMARGRHSGGRLACCCHAVLLRPSMQRGDAQPCAPPTRGVERVLGVKGCGGSAVRQAAGLVTVQVGVDAAHRPALCSV